MTPAAVAAHLRLDSPARERAAGQGKDNGRDLTFAATVEAEKAVAVGEQESPERNDGDSPVVAGTASSPHAAGEDDAPAPQDLSAARGALTALLAIQALERGSLDASPAAIRRDGRAATQPATTAVAEQAVGLSKPAALSSVVAERHGIRAADKVTGGTMPADASPQPVSIVSRELQSRQPDSAGAPIAVDVKHLETHFAPVGEEFASRGPVAAGARDEGLRQSYGLLTSEGKAMPEARRLAPEPARPGATREATLPVAPVGQHEARGAFSAAPVTAIDVAEALRNRVSRTSGSGFAEAPATVMAGMKAGGTARKSDVFTNVATPGNSVSGPGEDRRDLSPAPALTTEVADPSRERAPRVIASGLAETRTGAPGENEVAAIRTSERSQRVPDTTQDAGRGVFRELKLDAKLDVDGGVTLDAMPAGAVDGDRQQTGPAATSVGQQLFQAIAGGAAPPATVASRDHSTMFGAAHGVMPAISHEHARGSPVRVLKLALTPNEIGPVTIVIKGNASALSVSIEPAIVEAFAEIDTAREDLLQRLTGAGYHVTDLAVARGQPSADGPTSGAGAGQRDASHQPAGEHGRQGRPEGEAAAGRQNGRTGDEAGGHVTEAQRRSVAPRGFSTLRHV